MKALSWTAVIACLFWILLLGFIALANASAQDCPFSECGDSYILTEWLLQSWLYLGLVAVPAGILGVVHLVSQRGRDL